MRKPVSLNKCKHPQGYRWRVRYPDGEKRLQRFFRKKTEAEEFLNDKIEELEETGTGDESITPAERRAVISFREAVAALPGDGERPTLSKAVEFYLDHLKQRHKAISCDTLAVRLIKRIKANKNSKQYIYSTEKRLERFNATYGDWLACDITTEIVNDWLGDLDLAPQTVRHYRAALHHLFELGIEQGGALENPVAKAINPKVKKGEVGILTPTQSGELLSKADDTILPALAIGLFAGIRRAELTRLDWSEIDLEDGHIEIKASKSKTAQRRLIQIQPNLAAWLAPLARKTGPIMPTEMSYRHKLKKACTAAKIKVWPHNCLRHSFASYYLAHFKNAPALALELGHNGTDLLFQRYRELVKPKAAKTYWNIFPIEAEKVTHIKPAKAKRA